MNRVNRGVVARSRHKKILKQAKGYYGGRSRCFKIAKQAVIKAHQYAYRDRKNKKRAFRSLWITRINAAARNQGMSYSKFMHALQQQNIVLNRKNLAELALFNPNVFANLLNRLER